MLALKRRAYDDLFEAPEDDRGANAFQTSMLIVAIATVLSGSILWMIEAEAQPEHFHSIPAGIWWAIISITTIGYGDVAPVTPLGKAVGGVIAVLGICIFALPVGVLGAGFVEEMAKAKGRPMCGSHPSSFRRARPRRLRRRYALTVGSRCIARARRRATAERTAGR